MKLYDVYPLNPIEIVSGLGSEVFDKKGTAYLDLYGGHAVISVGHSHPHYIESIASQLNQLGFYSNSVEIPQQVQFAALLGAVSNKEDYQLFLCNSGAEANENALKLASFYNGRTKVVAFEKAFHGRTSLAVAATANSKIAAPINNAQHMIFLPFNDVEALEAVFKTQGDQIAAVIVEAIQGVGGIRVATPAFLQAISRLTQQYQSVFIADEVQCGYGRTGDFFAVDAASVSADIYTMAKGIGNGFPMGALAIASQFKPWHGQLGTTFGGNHLACAAGRAVLEIIKQEELMRNAKDLGSYLTNELKKMEGILEVRGRGLMMGIELPQHLANFRRDLLFEDKIFTGTASPNVIRLLPALNLSKQQADVFLERFQARLKRQNL